MKHGVFFLSEDETYRRVRVRCRCGTSFIWELPNSLEHLLQAKDCPSCSKVFYMKDKVIQREDGSMLSKMRPIMAIKPTVFKDSELDEDFLENADPVNDWKN